MTIAEALESLEERIQGACGRSGRKREEIRLMAVSKFQPRSRIEEALKSGLRLFGENRVQEAAEKFSGPSPDCEVHLIGSLQRNKAKTAARLFDCIQSVDREEILVELARHAEGREKPLRVLLELRTGEDSKSGFPDEEGLFRAAERLLSLPGLSVEGLMTMAPFSGDEKLIRASFRALVHAQGALASRFPPASYQDSRLPGGRVSWRCLSMGMSGDFEIAVEEGSTLLRIGTAVFGERT
jgi:pyridoxal phosphate enzyme (YggS family)